MNLKLLFLFLVCLFHSVPSVLATPIIGGFLDRNQDFKYHVSLHAINLRTRAYEYICGGTIIHEKHILTAAHCFMKKENHEITKVIDLTQEQPKIIAGTNRIDGRGIEKDIVKIFIPTFYENSPRMYADIAVLQLSDNLDLARNRIVIEKKSLGQISVASEMKKMATFCGYGYYDHVRMRDKSLRVYEKFSDINRFVTVEMLGKHDCPNFESEICARSFNKLEFSVSCFGDSGAGLITDKYVIGVLSRGPENCDTNISPMEFVRLWKFKDFINNAMNEHANHPDMFILERNLKPHHSRLDMAGLNTPNKPKKGGFHFPKFLKNYK